MNISKVGNQTSSQDPQAVNSRYLEIYEISKIKSTLFKNLIKEAKLFLFIHLQFLRPEPGVDFL